MVLIATYEPVPLVPSFLLPALKLPFLLTAWFFLESEPRSVQWVNSRKQAAYDPVYLYWQIKISKNNAESGELAVAIGKPVN